ncbi:MAG: hypothetical protein K9I35_02600 [Flavobacterium sp.]|nr:hypothetical protein [Flavobacterium sp.]
MKEEKKIDFEFNVNKQLQEQIKNSKYLKYGATALIAVGGILAVGFAFKIFNYAILNLKELSHTIKRKG